jgi:hypothetical protein
VKPWLFAYNAGVGFRYSLHRNWAAEINPWFRYYPSSLLKTEGMWMKQYYSQAGLSFVLRYTIPAKSNK